jgi:hypothetical protein
VSEYTPHDGSHQDCQPCFAIKLSSIQFQGIDAGQRRFTEKERDRDLDTYQKLRRQGYQPKHIYGSSEIAAQANTKFELEHSVVMPTNIRKQMDERIEQTKELFNTEPSSA